MEFKAFIEALKTRLHKDYYIHSIRDQWDDKFIIDYRHGIHITFDMDYIRELWRFSLTDDNTFELAYRRLAGYLDYCILKGNFKR